MTMLMEKMGLSTQSTTHAQFVEKFSTIQKESLEAEKTLNELYMLGRSLGTPKRKKRSKKEKETVNEEDYELNIVKDHNDLPNSPKDWE